MKREDSPYTTLAKTIAINAVMMFCITYAMIDTADHFYANLNRGYMTVMMVAPMVILMLLMMRSMYRNAKLNQAILIGSAAVFVVAFSLARSQTAIGDDQFLRSMIPHHSSAILMCREAAVTDPEILDLCEQIVQAQKEEIAQMKAILARR